MQVSVIIPCFNSSDSLDIAVQSALDQSLPPYEILCVDDASENDTELRLSHMRSRIGERLKVFRQAERGGIGAARNRGVAEATGEWIALLDHDDLWLPHKLRTQAEALSRNPTSALIHSRCWEERADSGSERSLMHAWKWGGGASPFPYLFLSNYIVPCTVLIRRDALIKYGGFEERLDRHGKDDIELWLRLAQHRLPFTFVEEPLAVRRLHEHNYSSNLEEFLRGRFEVLREAFDRDRNGSRELLISEALVRLFGILFDRVRFEIEADVKPSDARAMPALIAFIEECGALIQKAGFVERLGARFPAPVPWASNSAAGRRRPRIQHRLECGIEAGRALATGAEFAALVFRNEGSPVALSVDRVIAAASRANRTSRRAYRRRAEFEQRYGEPLVKSL